MISFKEMRKELGLTQRQVSEKTGWSVCTVQRMEAGKLQEDGVAYRMLTHWMLWTYDKYMNELYSRFMDGKRKT